MLYILHTLGVEEAGKAELLLGGVEGIVEVVGRVGFGQLVVADQVGPGK